MPIGAQTKKPGAVQPNSRDSDSLLSIIPELKVQCPDKESRSEW
jgi:hypothetical protein